MITTGTTPCNQKPAAADDSYSINEDTTLNVAAQCVLSNDTDADADNLTTSKVAGSGPSYGTLTFNADGSFDYTPDANFNGTVTIDYQVTDRGDPDECGPAGTNCTAPKSTSGTVTVTVSPVNDDPTVAVAAGGSCGTNDRSGTINLAVTDPDGQAQTASLKLSAISSNTALVPNANLTFGGSGASSTLTATALSGKTGTATITVTVTDDDEAKGTVALTLQAGGNSNDTSAGTADTDILLGQNGDDTLRSMGGKDLMCGGRGNDGVTTG